MSPQQSGEDPPEPTPALPPERDQATPSGTRSLKLWDLPIKTTVAGAAVLATLRAFRRRRASRKKRRDELSSPTSAIDTARAQLRAAANLAGRTPSVPPTQPNAPPGRARTPPEGLRHPPDATRVSSQQFADRSFEARSTPSVEDSAPDGSDTSPVDADTPPASTPDRCSRRCAPSSPSWSRSCSARSGFTPPPIATQR